MTIDKAIECIELKNRYPWNKDNSLLKEALKLGVEALRRCQVLSTHPIFRELERLPGETEVN